jgi:hypothetical protein
VHFKDPVVRQIEKLCISVQKGFSQHIEVLPYGQVQCWAVLVLDDRTISNILTITMSQSPTYKLDSDDESYVPYIPVAQRRQEKLAKLSTWGVHPQKDRVKKNSEARTEDAEREEENRRELVRKERTLLMEAQEVHSKKAVEGELLVSRCLSHPNFTAFLQ